jgi:hypothetical protein
MPIASSGTPAGATHSQGPNLVTATS